MIDRALAVFGVALGIIGPVLPVMFPKINKKFAWATFIVGLICVGFAFQMLLMPAGAETQPQPSINGNCNGNNSGTFTNNNCSSTFNVAPGRLQFTPAIGEQILEMIPKDKPVDLQVVGSQLDVRVGQQIRDFMKGHGYDVSMTWVSVMAPAPTTALSFSDRGSETQFIVAPSAH